MYAVLFFGRMSLFDSGVEVWEFLRTLKSIFGEAIRASVLRLTEVVSDPARLSLIPFGVNLRCRHGAVPK
jgi:hypothetical protein